MIKWLLKKQNMNRQKELILFLIEQLDHNIDNTSAETMLAAVVKSSGNKVTSFIVKD